MKILLERSELHQAASFKKEFVLSNGIGGYTASSILLTQERKHHGLLVASLNPPTERRMFFQSINEWIETKNGKISLDSVYPTVNPYLKSFEYDSLPLWTYESEQWKIVKTVSPEYLHNTLLITYDIETYDVPVEFSLTPHFQFRDHGDVSNIDALHPTTEFEGQVLILKKDQYEIAFSVSEGEYFPLQETIYGPISYPIDEATGDTRKDYNYTPFEIKKTLRPNENIHIEVMVSTEGKRQISVTKKMSEYSERMKKLSQTDVSFYLDEEFQLHYERLLMSADSFVVKRKSTNALTVLAGYPWFTDWGRDTMIAFEGLLLSTERFEDAYEVLKSFQAYIKNGLIPNMFPDEGSAPIYNTVDASLWYINALYLYAKYTKEYIQIKETFFESMKQIVEAYIHGTDFNIGMDEDGLIHAGSGLDQVTWMDVRINGEVITPRHGKPVEINALWYNALKIMQFFDTNGRKEVGSSYANLAKIVKTNFLRKFWNKSNQSLYDVVDLLDESVRPNQIYAISLPFTMLSKAQSKKVLKRIEEELVDIHGLRSLSIKDPRFIKEYSGDIVSRDHAYHMGTSWGFLLGTYFNTYLKVHRFSMKSIRNIKEPLLAALKETEQGCLFGYAEVFDGQEGKVGKGCYSQAWSVAEFVRVLREMARVNVE
ncbi:MAG: amylo-alpha-1,6-glucosidase [Candidatus Izemoplasmatales bacterium]